MEAMLIVFGASILAFLAALFSLLRVRGTCAGTCERLGQLACEGCPRVAERRARDEGGERRARGAGGGSGARGGARGAHGASDGKESTDASAR